MSPHFTVRITANFDRNLEEISTFLRDKGALEAFDSTLEKLFGTVIPNFERFPDIGHDFTMHQPHSVEGAARLQALTQQAGNNISLRELIADDYLILYAVKDREIFLLSIKHHRQLSFDLKAHWI